MSTYTQPLESIGKAADAFGETRIKFSFTVKTSPDGKVKFTNPSFDEMPINLATCIFGALSKAEKEYNENME